MRMRTGWCGVLALTLVTTVSTMTHAQQRWQLRAAMGQAYFNGDEGSTIGMSSEIGVVRSLNANRALQLSLFSHQFRGQSIPACLIPKATRCFSSSERQTAGLLLGLRQRLPNAPLSGLEVNGGVGVFLSTRTLTDAADCTVASGCVRAEIKDDWEDVAYGVYTGLGRSFVAGNHEFVVELGFHIPVVYAREHKPLSRYRVMPVAFAIHF